MQFLPSRGYELDRCSNSINILYGVSSSSKVIERLENPTMCSKSTVVTAEAAAEAACKSHSEAERRRRKRINGHLATLRTLLPNTIKTDKASLLAEVVRCVKELKKTTADIVASSTDQSEGCTTISRVGNDRYYLIPSETDELNLSYGDGGDPVGTIKASLCCEDRRELIPELTRALSSIHAKMVRTEMATVGGRMKCVLWVQVSSVTTGDEQGLRLVRQALMVVMDRVTLLALPGNKRPCLSHN